MIRGTWYTKLLKELVPPIILKFRSRFKDVGEAGKEAEFSGDYDSWESAKADCAGYEDGLILETCKDALLKVKNGAFAYERDGILFNEIQYSWPLLTGLQKAALDQGGVLSVLDFGGSLGSSYFQNRSFLAGVKKLSWSIVEQKHFVDCGKQHFQADGLQFYYSMEECLLNENPNVLLLSGVLQYLEDPYHWLSKFNLSKIPYIILDRTSFVQHSNDIPAKQQVPESMYKASYPTWFLNESNLAKSLSNYEQLVEFACSYDPANLLLNGRYKASWKGMIYKSRN
jgi:putative methyltransferase (TIGR04325 family)